LPIKTFGAWQDVHNVLSALEQPKQLGSHGVEQTLPAYPVIQLVQVLASLQEVQFVGQFD